LGIISSIGNNAEEVTASLKAGTSGIETSPEMAEHGFRSQVAGTLKIDPSEHIDKRTLRFMGPGAAYAYLAMQQAIDDARLDIIDVSNPRTGLIAEQIMLGKQDVMFAGGGEELDWTLSCLFDAMGAMSSKYNDAPTTASRAFDANRDGFVITGGGGIVVLEELEHAKARNAKIYAEVTGFAATSDGHDMVAPSGEGGARAMELALATLPEGRKVSYINAHGTSTPVGDVGEIEAVRRVFGEGQTPPVSSTKSMTGHGQGAAGAMEAIFCLLMLEHDFIAPSINVGELDPALDPSEIATKRVDNAQLDSVMTNSFGFGGTNGSMILSTFKE